MTAVHDAIEKCYEISTGQRLVLRAREIARERTGVHARVSILLNDVTLAWSRLNVEDDKQRVHIANSAHKHFGDLDARAFPAGHLKHALDLFCSTLWDQHVGELMGEMMEGNPDIGPPQLLCGNYVMRGGGTIIYAPPGRGKSYTALAMAVSMDAGVSYLWPSQATKVCYLNLERSRDSMAHRLSRVNEAMGLPARRPLAFLNVRGKSLPDMEEAARRTMEEFEAEVLIVDSISRTGMNGSLKDDTTANRIVDMLNRLAPTWLALGHTPRADESHLYGAIHFEAGEDIGAQLTTQTTDNGMTTGVGLQVTKANDLPAGLPLAIHVFVWDQSGLIAIRQGRRREFPELAAGRKASPLELAREYLGLVGKADAQQIGDAIGKHRSDVSRVLAECSDIGRETQGHRVVFYLLR